MYVVTCPRCSETLTALNGLPVQCHKCGQEIEHQVVRAPINPIGIPGPEVRADFSL